MKVLACVAIAVVLSFPAAAQWTPQPPPADPSTGISTVYNVGIGPSAHPWTRLRLSNPAVATETPGSGGQLAFGTVDGQYWLFRNDSVNSLYLDRFYGGWSNLMKFDVSGPVTINNTTTINGIAGIGVAPYASTRLRLANPPNATETPGSGGQIAFGTTTGQYWMFRLDSGSTLHLDRCCWMEGVAFALNGNVGIGTANPGINGMNNTLTVQGAATRGMLELSTGQGDGDGVGAGQVGFFASANTANKQLGAIYTMTSGPTANNRGGMMTFWTKPDGGGLTEAMRLDRDGRLGIGTPNPQYTLDVNGTIRATQVIGATYQDIAEWVPATEPMEAGTVVVLNDDRTNEVMPSLTPYDTKVAGVVSAQPGVILGESSPSKAKIATTGRVKVRVDASRGGIRVGDLLVTSGKPGVAMRSEPVDFGGGVKMHRPGTMIGKALEPLASGEGEILVLLSLQ